MIKFEQGWIGSADASIKKPVIVKAAAPNSLKDALIGGVIVLIGITYLTVTAFRHGSQSFEIAEFKTMEELGLI